MRVKKNSRKKVVVDNEEKENLNSINDSEQQRVHQMIENQEIIEIQNNLMKDNEQLATRETFDNSLSSSVDTTEIEKINSFVCDETNVTASDSINLTSTQGEKRSIEHITDLSDDHSSSSSSNDSSYGDGINYKKRCVELEDRIKQLESEWMPKPNNPEIVKFFIEMANMLQHDKENDNIIHDKVIIGITKALKIDQNQLKKCKKRTATATARSLIRCLYPNPDSQFGYAQVDKTIIDTILEYSTFSNPLDNASGTELRRAISNYFSSMAHKRKVNLKDVTNIHSKEQKKVNDNTKSKT